MLSNASGQHAAQLGEIVARAMFERNVLGDVAEFELTEPRTLYAAAYALIRIGNTVAQHSRTLEQAYPDYHWVYWVNLRNELAHELGNVNIQRVWQAVAVSIPELVSAIAGRDTTQ